MAARKKARTKTRKKKAGTTRKRTSARATARRTSTKKKSARKGTIARATARRISTKKKSARKVARRSGATRTPVLKTTGASESLRQGPAGTQQVLDDARIPTLALEDQPLHIASSKGVEDETCGSTKYAWVGSGQCGNRLVESFYKLGYRKVLALNSAYHDLNEVDIPSSQRLLMDIGPKGAGKDMRRGRDAALQYRREITKAIEDIFCDEIDHIMLAFGCGGGTGSGSAVPLLDTLRAYAKRIGLHNANRRVGVLCTLPTAGEAASPRVALNVSIVMKELTDLAARGKISPLIIVDNEKISRLYPGLTVANFFPTINNTVSGLFDIFNRLSALSSPYIAFDSVDYQSVMQCGGCAIMGLTKVERQEDRYRLFEAMRSNVSKTLLAEGFDLATAKVVGTIVVGGKSIFRNMPGLQDQINHAFDVLTDVTGEATVHRGILEDDKPSIRVYTIIGGLDAPADRLEELRRVA